VYSNDDEYFADVAKAYQAELKILYDAGLRNAQVDDPNLAYFCSEAMLEGWKKDDENFQTAEEQFDAYLRFYSDCFKVGPELDKRYWVYRCADDVVAEAGRLPSGHPSLPR